MSTVVGIPVGARSGRHIRTVGLAWREARPVVQVIFQVRFGVAALLAAASVPGEIHSGRLAAGAAAWLCATWHVYLLNGLSDRTEDRRNGSARPLASGRLDDRDVRTTLSVLAVTALVLGALAGWRVALLAGLMMALGAAYSTGPYPLKRCVPGAIAVITAGGLATYLAGWCAAGGGTPGPSLLVVGGAMSLWMGLAGMTKDLSDVSGDRIAGRRTLPIILGARRARLLIATWTVGLAGVALVTADRTGMPVLFPVVLAIGANAVAAALLAARRPRKPYGCFMVTQYGAHLAVVSQSLV
jgi:4-hydroxybenzoate polyprenyltransferase